MRLHTETYRQVQIAQARGATSGLFLGAFIMFWIVYLTGWPIGLKWVDEQGKKIEHEGKIWRLVEDDQYTLQIDIAPSPNGDDPTREAGGGFSRPGLEGKGSNRIQYQEATGEEAVDRNPVDAISP